MLPHVATPSDWEKSLTEPGDRWWTERPVAYTWGEMMRLTAGAVTRPLSLKRPDSLMPGDALHPLVVRAMLAPEALGDALVTLPWSVLMARQPVSPSSGYVHTSPVVEVLLPRADETVVHRLAARVLDDAANVFNDPTFRFQERDLPFNGRSHLPPSLGDSHRSVWQLLQNTQVRRSLAHLTETLGTDGAPDASTVVRWQRWAMVLACTTYSQAEAQVIGALVQHGHPVPLRMVTPGSVLKNVPDMPLGFFVSLHAQGIDLAACTGYYQQTGGGKWKSMPPRAVNPEQPGRALLFNLLDLAALRRRYDLVAWALDLGLRPSNTLAEPLLALLRQDLLDATAGRRAEAEQRLTHVEGMFLRAAHADAAPSTEPATSPSTPRRRL